MIMLAELTPIHPQECIGFILLDTIHLRLGVIHILESYLARATTTNGRIGGSLAILLHHPKITVADEATLAFGIFKCLSHRLVWVQVSVVANPAALGISPVPHRTSKYQCPN